MKLNQVIPIVNLVLKMLPVFVSDVKFIIIIIIIIIIIFINCNLVITRWQCLFYMYTNMERKKSN